MTEDFIKRYASDVCNCLRLLDPGPILQAINALYAAWRDGKIVLFCGNGGSGASCSHIVNDLQKNVNKECCRPLKAICLNDCTPLVTAIANDEAWHYVFSDQVDYWAEDDALLVAVSGSGNSLNVVNAASAAYCRCMKTITLTGFDGGRLKDANNSINIHVPIESMQQAEDAHMVILHMLYLGLIERIKAA